MVGIALRILLSGPIEAICQMAVTRVLTMRSRPTYHVIRTAYFLSGAFLKSQETFPMPVRVIGGLAFEFVLPYALSVGSPLHRAVRVFLINFVTFVVDLTGITLYLTLIGNPSFDPQAIGQENITVLAAVYLMLAFISAAFFEVLVAVCNRADKTGESFFNVPNVMLSLGATVVFAANYGRFLGSGAVRLSDIACSALSLGGIYLIFVVAWRDAASQREAADAALAARKAKHTVAQVRAMAWRARGLEALRHSLASDVRKVPRLAAAGQADVAARELSGLVEQAHILNGGKHE